MGSATPQVRRSVCALDCPDTCSLLVTVKDGRGVRLRGDPAHPVTRGFLCAKVARYLEREYSPMRLLHPLRRTGTKGEGKFERIGWEEALDEIAFRLRAVRDEWGPEAILPYNYSGTMGLVQGASMDRRFFHRLGASHLLHTICSEAGTTALEATYGCRLGTDPEQFRHAKLIIAWGANILGTNVHLWPFIVEARRNGARFYTIDPVRNRTGEAADRHYFIHPGTDLALALGMIHVILREKLYDAAYLEAYAEGFGDLRALAERYPPERTAELTGIPAGEIVELAVEYATMRPAAIRLNYGLQRCERGAAAVRAVTLLPVLTGAWRDLGGGMLLTTSGGFQLDFDALARPDLVERSGLGRPPRSVNMVRLGRALTELDTPPVKALVVYDANPAATAPRQELVIEGLRREDLFTVVIEQFPTDTADYADIVLPATTFLEHTDLYLSYGHYYLQMARPALPAPGEARPNFRIFQELARRLGFDEDCFRDSEDDVIRQALASGHPYLEGITLEKLEREGFARVNVVPPGKPFLPFADGGFGTPSGKYVIDAGRLEYTPPDESRRGDEALRRRYPLELVTPKSDEGLSSTFSYRDEVAARCRVLEIHPEDAARRGIGDGDGVRVFNSRGSCRLVARVSGGVAAGVVCARAAAWRKKLSGPTPNALTSDALTDEGEGAVFYSCLVEVERC